jgi:hypothetical protein
VPQSYLKSPESKCCTISERAPAANRWKHFGQRTFFAFSGTIVPVDKPVVLFGELNQIEDQELFCPDES